MCDPNPCMHLGTCSPRPEGYKCLCTSAYVGEHCEHISLEQERPLAIILGVVFALLIILIILLVIFCLYLRNKRKTIIEVREKAPPGTIQPQGPVVIANGRTISLPPSLVGSEVKSVARPVPVQHCVRPVQQPQRVIIQRPQQSPQKRIYTIQQQPKSILRNGSIRRSGRNRFIEAEINYNDYTPTPRPGSLEPMDAEIIDDDRVLLAGQPRRESIFAEVRDDIEYLDYGKPSLPY